jgi:hypothetical protein
MSITDRVRPLLHRHRQLTDIGLILATLACHFQAVAQPSGAAGCLLKSRPRHRSQTGNPHGCPSKCARTGIDHGRHRPMQAPSSVTAAGRRTSGFESLAATG